MIYSVIYVNKLNDKKVLCFRRYDNFDKLNNKLKKKFPYVIIPNLPPKNSLAKIMSYNNEFFKSRMILLTFYVNFLNNHIILKETKEFKKFINDVEFDENFFNDGNNKDNSDINNNNNYNLKNKIYNVINFLGSGIKTRKLNDSEILIKKLYTHYKNIIEKYQILNKNIYLYIKSIKTKGNEYKKISDNLLFIKDTFNNVKESSKNINDFAVFSEIISKSYLNQIELSEKLNFKLDALINLLLGICNSLDNYVKFIKKYEDVSECYLQSKKNGNNLEKISFEYEFCEKMKNKYENILSRECNNFIEIFDETTNQCLGEFREIINKINRQNLNK